MSEALTIVPELGKATKCEAGTYHWPTPLRYIWHHKLPQACGGKTVAANLVQLCDTCHYAVHAILFALKEGQPIPDNAGRKRTALAQYGYDAAVAAGTVDKIPNEGGSTVG